MTKKSPKEESPEGAIYVESASVVEVVPNGEVIIVDAKALDDADDLRALNEAKAEGGVRPFAELIAELGLE